MPAFIASRLYRILPLLIILGIVALIIYFIASWRYTPARAKEILIALFSWINIGLSGFFLLATVYAALEGNWFVAEFFVWFLVTTLLLLLITYLCKRSFLKHHPNYQWKVNVSGIKERLARAKDARNAQKR